jgi:ubiquinone/menaquinone biosynthesis C-methylase UbiE
MADSLVLVDAHVHVHPMANVGHLLDSAARNFESTARSLGAKRWQGALLLTEMKDADWFSSVPPGGLQAGSWRLIPDPDDLLALLARRDGLMLTLVRGRQIVTSEGIEVLALGCRSRVADGQPLRVTLAAAAADADLAVLPWAVGKWLGRRGALVAEALEAQATPVLAGDNGGRAVFWPRPAQFAIAESRGRAVLSGSDPLPLANDERRVGSYGSWFAGSLPESAGGRSLMHQLRNLSPSALSTFGPRQGPVDFFRNQLLLRTQRGHVRPESRQVMGAIETPDIETSSADYARRFAGAAGRYLLDVQSAAIRHVLRDLPPGTALDVGGGHGQLVGLLRELGWQVTVHGSDPACERNLRDLHGQRDCAFVQGDLFNLPLADRSFDLVIAVRLISHVENWPRLIGELCRVSRRAVVLDYPAKGALNALTPLLFGLKKSLEGNTRTYTSFSKAELAREFDRHGFAAPMQRKQFFLPMVVHRVGRANIVLRMAEAVFRGVGLTAVFGSPVILRADRQ